MPYLNLLIPNVSLRFQGKQEYVLGHPVPALSFLERSELIFYPYSNLTLYSVG